MPWKVDITTDKGMTEEQHIATTAAIGMSRTYSALQETKRKTMKRTIDSNKTLFMYFEILK